MNKMIDKFFGKLLKKNKGKDYCYGPTESEDCHCDYCVCRTSFGREGHHHHHHHHPKTAAAETLPKKEPQTGVKTVKTDVKYIY